MAASAPAGTHKGDVLVVGTGAGGFAAAITARKLTGGNCPGGGIALGPAMAFGWIAAHRPARHTPLPPGATAESLPTHARTLDAEASRAPGRSDALAARGS
jgi:NADPH-dependent 2,4-dienoyl-CoA reductase/sulfur reductase-like enzyme